jgi:hypothetical protein
VIYIEKDFWIIQFPGLIPALLTDLSSSKVFWKGKVNALKRNGTQMALIGWMYEDIIKIPN